MRRILSRVAGATLAIGLLASAALGAEKTIAYRAARIHTMAGAPIENGLLLIRDGKIAAIGVSIEIPDGVKVEDLGEAEITPGLIDANCALRVDTPQTGLDRPSAMWADPRLSRSIDPLQYEKAAGEGYWKNFLSAAALAHQHDEDEAGALCLCGKPPAWMGMGVGLPFASNGTEPFAVLREYRQTFAEQSAEVIPHLTVADSLNLLSSEFDRLARGGVTAVYVAPDSASVIGARGTIVKTAGPAGSRFVVREADIQAALGVDPSVRGQRNRLPPGRGGQPTPVTRRPTTRMGVDFVFRKAFYDAERMAAGLPVHGADTPPAEAAPFLNALRDGKQLLRIQARKSHDLASALRLAREFGLRIALVEAVEAYVCIPAIREAGVPVVFGPTFMDPSGWRAATGEAREPRLNTAALLYEAGIPLSLTANDQRGEAGLVRQASFAAQAGLPANAALEAVATRILSSGAVRR
jgi:imidazolonepropionase-like amidohydrolase